LFGFDVETEIVGFMGEEETGRYRERKKEGRVGPRPNAKVALLRLIWCFKTEKKERKRDKG